VKKPHGDLAVVTGASRGIGRATALGLARRGVRVALLGRSSPMLDDAAEAAQAAGVEARTFVCDVAREDDVARAAEEVLASMGTPRVVINNAGIVRRGPRVEDTSPVDWDDVIAVNLRGPFLVSRAFLPSMLRAKHGRLVHVASIAATIGSPGAASYAASKWGLVGLSKSLAEELRGTARGQRLRAADERRRRRRAHRLRGAGRARRDQRRGAGDVRLAAPAAPRTADSAASIDAGRARTTSR
jgi:NAD(P)-dependent dehydrogenase (short-subunit alcohol dehydrogenase family)